MSDGTTDVPPTRRASDRRTVIPVSCALHRGPAGFANLVVRKCDGEIELDPHATGACTITLDKDGAGALRDVLIEWLG